MHANHVEAFHFCTNSAAFLLCFTPKCQLQIQLHTLTKANIQNFKLDSKNINLTSQISKDIGGNHANIEE